MNYYIKEDEWKDIFQFLSSRKDIRSKKEAKLRIFIEAVYYIMRTGCQWRMLPTYYGKWRSIHQRFSRWVTKGIFEELFKSHHDEADTEWIMIDSTIIRANACSAGYQKDSGDEQGLGRSNGGFTSKIHALVDALGNPLKFIVTPGQRNDITQGEDLIDGFENTAVIADKGYDSNALIDAIYAKSSRAVIPSKKNRKVKREHDEDIYKERHLVECFFSKIKYFRRIFSRFDKTVKNFMGFLNFVGALIWLR
ncbi:MAG: IS5 family transposase [Rickettsiaceae bacterium]|nr:IS5 family transposase [Rickettsiaceae bacterium]